MLRSIGAIVAGFVLIAVSAFGPDALVVGAFPSEKPDKEGHEGLQQHGT